MLLCPMSPSSRRAWIEILVMVDEAGNAVVALLAEGVDRNFVSCCPCSFILVALLAEGVDRNLMSAKRDFTRPKSPSSRRAWIEILCVAQDVCRALVSPSSRRAWIEI